MKGSPGGLLLQVARYREESPIRRNGLLEISDSGYEVKVESILQPFRMRSEGNCIQIAFTIRHDLPLDVVTMFSDQFHVHFDRITLRIGIDLEDSLLIPHENPCAAPEDLLGWALHTESSAAQRFRFLHNESKLT